MCLFIHLNGIFTNILHQTGLLFTIRKMEVGRFFVLEYFYFSLSF